MMDCIIIILIIYNYNNTINGIIIIIHNYEIIIHVI
nr:MAG TPA: hypothetical protein [Bacteriophage sp.]